MRHIFLFLSFCFAMFTTTGYSQITVSVSGGDDGEQAPPKDSIVTTQLKAEGSPFDTAIFDSTNRVPFKVHEYRGDEMIHNWITVGAPRAPHFYLGGGIYRFDKGGLNDIQFGWYPIQVWNRWETYLSAERMFFFRRTSKEVRTPVAIDVDYYNGKVIKYCYEVPLRRDKFYGVVTGVSYEGFMNPANQAYYIRHGENSQYQLHRYYKVSARVGIGRMRCRNIEYEAPFRRKGKFRASSMSRLQLGVIAFPIQKYDYTVIAGSFSEADIPQVQVPLAGYFSWEGRTAIMHRKREWGFSANFTFIAPSWNRVNEDFAFAINCTSGLYFSLDKKNPDWRKKYGQ